MEYTFAVTPRLVDWARRVNDSMSEYLAADGCGDQAEVFDDEVILFVKEYKELVHGN